MPKVELQISPFPAHVRTARLVAAALGRRLGLDSVTIDEIKLAVGEACSRAVHVHEESAPQAPIIVEFRDDDEILEIAVLDGGPGGAELPAVDPSDNGVRGDSTSAARAAADDLLRETARIAAAAPESAPPHQVAKLVPGLGLAVIAGLVDDVSVEYRTDSPGTAVTMRWPIVTF